jgi:hypothetical protein
MVYQKQLENDMIHIIQLYLRDEMQHLEEKHLRVIHLFVYHMVMQMYRHLEDFHEHLLDLIKLIKIIITNDESI